MSKIKKYIQMIVDNGKQEDMECLSDILSDVIYLMKEEHYDKYKHYKNKLKGMAYNYEINEDMAYEIVEEMSPSGELWNIETIKSVIGEDKHRLCDMYVVMNSLYNDYGNVINKDDVNTYIKMAHAWLDDEDGKENKIWWYFVN